MQFLLAVLLAAKLITVPYIEYTEEDVKIVGDVGWLENGHTGKTEDENRQCIIATMAVFVNRMKDGGWGGHTAKGVLTSPRQYASHTKNNVGKTDTPDWVYELAEEVLMYGTNVPDYVIYQSQQSKLGTHWKIIAGEYFATNGGHYMEGKEIHIETNKAIYIQQCFNQFKKQAAKFSKRTIKNIKKYLQDINLGLTFIPQYDTILSKQ